MKTENLINRIRILLHYGLSVEEIRKRCRDEAKDDELFLAWTAARRLNEVS